MVLYNLKPYDEYGLNRKNLNTVDFISVQELACTHCTVKRDGFWLELALHEFKQEKPLNS